MSASTPYYLQVLPCPCGSEHDRMTAHTLGMVCGRCGEHTGNNNQGHYWGFCKVTRTVRDLHFCCPNNCALEHPQDTPVTDHECDSGWFDRVVCGCGAMHSYCDTCGKLADHCPYESAD